MQVWQLMRRQVATCQPTDNLSIAAQKMWEFDIGCLPVLDLSGRVIGIITDRDICMAAYTQGRPVSDIPVSIAMSKDVFSCAPNDTIQAAEEEMRRHQVRRLPVIDQSGNFIGILSLNDLIREADRELASDTPEITPTELADTIAEICEPRGPRDLAPIQ